MPKKPQCEGRGAASLIDAFLRGVLAEPEPQFNIRLGVLSDAELAIFQSEAAGDGRAPALAAGLSDPQAVGESARCLHCECAKLTSCALRKYSIDYGANAGEYKMERRPFVRSSADSAVVFESGKCISCGICVQIAQRGAEPLGLTFVGRGFDVRVGVPFNGALSEALAKTARECVEACPTGALALKADAPR